MTEYRDDEELKPEQEAAQARVNVAKWSPWVWIVPAVAILIVGWLIVRYGFFGGGDVTVRFVEARGLDRYSPVRFRGAKVGTVQKITIDENLSQVVVRITLDASMTHALKKNTRFWIVEPGLEGGGLGGILSGTYVGIAPGDGEEATEFVGQEYPPVMSAPEAGKTFVLEGPGLGGLSAGTPVNFEGLRVGRILGSQFDERRQTTSVHVFVVQRFVNHVRETTRFFRSGGLSFSLGGGGVQMGDASLASLLNAPIAFYTPDVLAGAPAADGSRFQLYNSRNAAIAASDGPHMTYLTYFPGPINGLTVGTPVTMKGVQVGRVRDVRLRFVPETAALETPVTLEIDPRELEFDVNASTTREELRARLNDALGRLVHTGTRATLSTSLVLPGVSAVALTDVAGTGSGRLVVENDPPIIPAAAAGDGISGALSAVTDVANQIRSLPIREIAEHMRSTASRLNTLVSDPRLDQSLDRLNNSLAQMEKVANTAGNNAGPIVESLRNAAESAEATAKSVEATAATAGQNVGPIIESLRNAAASAEQAAKRAEQLLGTSQKQNYDVAELIRELTRAAQAVRELASYLSENPDSVIKGRRE
jgi:paraquat-inducible protein B